MLMECDESFSNEVFNLFQSHKLFMHWKVKQEQRNVFYFFNFKLIKQMFNFINNIMRYGEDGKEDEN